MGTNLHSTANYFHVVPNSHFWTDLNQLITSIEYHQKRIEHIASALNQPFTREYILVGLNNSVKNGYKLKVVNKPYSAVEPFAFTSIEDIINFVIGMPEGISDFGLFYKELQNTINNGMNLTNGKKMERTEVYKRIDGERDYQDYRWNTNLREGDVSDEEKPPAEWINYIEFHLSEAKRFNYLLNKEGALEEIRKVAALAVRALEIHGCPEREIPKESNPLIGGIMTPNNGTGGKPIGPFFTTNEVGNGGKKCGCGDDCECKTKKK